MTGGCDCYVDGEGQRLRWQVNYPKVRQMTGKIL